MAGAAASAEEVDADAGEPVKSVGGSGVLSVGLAQMHLGACFDPKARCFAEER